MEQRTIRGLSVGMACKIPLTPRPTSRPAFQALYSRHISKHTCFESTIQTQAIFLIFISVA